MGSRHFVPLHELSALLEAREFHGEAFAIAPSDDGTVVCLAQCKPSRSHARVCLDLNGFGPLDSLPVFAAVPIVQLGVRIVESFLIDIQHVRLIYRMAPAQVLVMPDGGKQRAEE